MNIKIAEADDRLSRRAHPRRGDRHVGQRARRALPRVGLAGLDVETTAPRGAQRRVQREIKRFRATDRTRARRDPPIVRFVDPDVLLATRGSRRRRRAAERDGVQLARQRPSRGRIDVEARLRLRRFARSLDRMVDADRAVRRCRRMHEQAREASGSTGVDLRATDRHEPRRLLHRSCRARRGEPVLRHEIIELSAAGSSRSRRERPLAASCCGGCRPQQDRSATAAAAWLLAASPSRRSRLRAGRRRRR